MSDVISIKHEASKNQKVFIADFKILNLILNQFLHFRAYVFLLVTIFIWGTAPIIMKISSINMQLGMFNCCRILITCLFLKICICFFYSNISIKKELKIKLIFLGMLTLAPYYHLFLLGLQHTPSAVAGLLFGIAPIWTVVLGYFTKSNKPNTYIQRGVFIAFCGLLIFFCDSNAFSSSQLNIYGNLLIVVAMFFFALYTHLSLMFQKERVNAYVFMYYVFLGCFISLFFISLYESFLYSFDKFSFIELSLINILGIFYIGICSSALSYAFFTYSTNILGNYKSSVFITLVPIISLVLGVYVLEESFTFQQLLALVIIVSGIYIVCKNQLQRTHLIKDGEW